jgi:hypothetical protein
MKLFDVYPLLDMEPVKAQGAYLWDKNGVEYLDFYGGHAVISIGHTHPHYVEKITEQLSKIGFYSNAVINSLQVELAEKIGETVVAAGGSEATDIAFVPVRGCHARGIMSDVVVRLDEDLEKIVEIFKTYYASHPFVCVSDKPVYMKQVVNTNYCFLSLQKEGRKLLITSVVDNLLKGASGQAVQNMNLMFGLDEMEGLRLKASYF